MIVKHFSIILMLLLPVLLINNVFADNDLKSDALKKLQNAVVDELKDETGISRISVVDIEGDDGSIKNALISAITEHTDLNVVERADLDKLLKEQGMQLGDIMDERSRVKYGRIKGVQGVLMGNASSMNEGFMKYMIRVHLKLDDVENGEIIFSKDFSVSSASPLRLLLILGGLFLIAIIFIIVYFSKKMVKIKEEGIRKDENVRTSIANEIVKAEKNIREARSKMMDKGKQDGAIALKELEGDLQVLREHVYNVCRGNTDMRDDQEIKRALAFDTEIKESFHYLVKSTDKVYNIASSDETCELEVEINVLKKDIKDKMNEFRDRGI